MSRRRQSRPRPDPGPIDITDVLLIVSVALLLALFVFLAAFGCAGAPTPAQNVAPVAAPTLTPRVAVGPGGAASTTVHASTIQRTAARQSTQTGGAAGPQTRIGRASTITTSSIVVSHALGAARAQLIRNWQHWIGMGAASLMLAAIGWSMLLLCLDTPVRGHWRAAILLLALALLCAPAALLLVGLARPP